MKEVIKIKEFVNKEKCDCGNVATWFYAPGGGSDEGQNYFCDNCVPRGCSCNWTYADKNAYGPEPLKEDLMPEGVEGKDWKWVVRAGDENMEEITLESRVWTNIDEQGREYPCCEFWYEEEGWDKT